MHNVRISTAKLLSALGTFLALNLLVIVIARGVSPVKAATYEFKISDFAEIDRHMCSDADSIFPYFGYTLVALPVVAALFLAYKTRNVQDDFTENKPILLALYTFAFASVIMIPITYLLGQENVAMVFYLDSFGILMVSTCSVLAFMVPKIKQQYRPADVRPSGYGNTMGTSSTMGGHTSAQDNTMDTDEIEKEMASLAQEIKAQKGTIEQMRTALAQFSCGEKPDVACLIGVANDGKNSGRDDKAAAPAGAGARARIEPSAGNAPESVGGGVPPHAMEGE